MLEASLADAQDLQRQPPNSDRLSCGYVYSRAERAFDAEHGCIVVIGQSGHRRGLGWTGVAVPVCSVRDDLCYPGFAPVQGRRRAFVRAHDEHTSSV